MNDDVVDRESPLPRWAQIAAILRQRIAEQGAEVTGLSDQALTREFGVSPLTVRQAVQDLVRSGLVTRHRGRGTFVVTKQKPVQGTVDHLEAYLSEWRVKGDDVRIEILERATTAASMAVAAGLQIAPGATVGYVRRLRHADGHPLGIDYRYILVEILSQLDDTDLQRETIWETIESKVGLPTLQSNTTIRAVLASAEEAALLKIPVGSPVLTREIQLIGTSGQPMMTGHSIYHPDRFIYATTIRRRQ
jgi:GntR family transcriptional regulator